MKRLLLVVACVLVLTGPAGANGFSFDGLYLWGTDYNSWMTEDYGHPSWILGVSLEWQGDLVQSEGSKSLPTPLGDGVYYLYAGNQELENLGVPVYGGLVSIKLYQVAESFTANFVRSGDPGEFKLWDLDWRGTSKTPGFVGDPTIYLGWAQGTADKVQPVTTNIGGDDKADWFLVLGVNVEPTNVPLPGAVWLLGTGLVGLIGLRRKLRA